MPLDTFELDVARWCNSALDGVVQKLRNAVVELCTRIIDDHPDEFPPTDEIVSKGDWNSAIGMEPGDVERNDVTGIRALDGVKAVVANWNPRQGDTFYFANYKPYILRIEYLGWGSTPPYGMVGKHVIEWDDIVREAGVT